MKFLIAFFSLSICYSTVKVQTSISDTIGVHFLYGSKPAKAFQDVERKWFGGILGGHVGIASTPNEIVNFLPNGNFHYLSSKTELNSQFVVSDSIQFYQILGGSFTSAQRTTIHIPVTAKQKEQLDSIHHEYLSNSPYDYAFIGMRCGSATYDVLAQLGIVRKMSKWKMALTIFYPRKLRHRLLRKAKKNNWRVCHYQGTHRRQWEEDWVYKSALEQCFPAP
ncbi:MAG: hypothetical protein KDC92_14670 [Bacteroidetes bacterium]|nr:hypothetical protein [Bacteroidota bacterium]